MKPPFLVVVILVEEDPRLAIEINFVVVGLVVIFPNVTGLLTVEITVSNSFVVFLIVVVDLDIVVVKVVVVDSEIGVVLRVVVLVIDDEVVAKEFAVLNAVVVFVNVTVVVFETFNDGAVLVLRDVLVVDP